MSLRRQTSLTAWVIRLGVTGLTLLGGSLAREPGVGLLLGLGWFFACGPLLRHIILPALFPALPAGD